MSNYALLLLLVCKLYADLLPYLTWCWEGLVIPSSELFLHVYL